MVQDLDEVAKRIYRLYWALVTGTIEREMQKLLKLVVRASKRGIRGGSSVTGRIEKRNGLAACEMRMSMEAI